MMMTVSLTERPRKYRDTITTKRSYRVEDPVCSDGGADFRFMIEERSKCGTATEDEKGNGNNGQFMMMVTTQRSRVDKRRVEGAVVWPAA
jgi:hypothetical protein